MKIRLRISAFAQQSNNTYYSGIYTEGLRKHVNQYTGHWTKGKERAEEARKKPLFLIKLEDKINKAEVQNKIVTEVRFGYWT
jgi:hypothetical protein